MTSSENTRTAFEPDCAQYHIKRDFDQRHQQSKLVTQYQDNLKNVSNPTLIHIQLWEISRQRCIPLIGKKQHPGPGAYETVATFEAKGHSFYKDMRVFDKQAREELRCNILRKEDSYVKDYAEMQAICGATRNGLLRLKTERDSGLGKRGTPKFSFPQQVRTTSIRSVS